MTKIVITREGSGPEFPETAKWFQHLLDEHKMLPMVGEFINVHPDDVDEWTDEQNIIDYYSYDPFHDEIAISIIGSADHSVQEGQHHAIVVYHSKKFKY